MFFAFELFKYSFEATLRLQRAYAENMLAALALSTKAAEDVARMVESMQDFTPLLAAKPLPYHAEGNLLVIDRAPALPHTHASFSLGSTAALYQFRKFNTVG